MPDRRIEIGFPALSTDAFCADDDTILKSAEELIMHAGGMRFRLRLDVNNLNLFSKINALDGAW